MPTCAHSPPSLPTTPSVTCPVCLEAVSSSVTVVGACQHQFCRSCLSKYCETAIRDGCVPVQCPGLASPPPATEGSRAAGAVSVSMCGGILPEAQVKSLVTETVFQQYTRFVAMRENPDLRECPRCGLLQVGDPALLPAIICGRGARPVTCPQTPPPGREALVLDVLPPKMPQGSPNSLRARSFESPARAEAGTGLLATAPPVAIPPPATPPPPGRHGRASSPASPEGCGYVFCQYHSDAHPGISCDAHVAQQARSPEVQASLKLLERDTKPCPHCGAGIELAGGCDHVRCPACKGDFCFRCGSKSLTGKYTRSCAQCGQIYIDHKYFSMWCCLLVVFSPVVLVLSVVWLLLAACLQCCRWRTLRFSSVKHRFWCCCYPVAVCLLFGQCMKDDPMADMSLVSPKEPPSYSHSHHTVSGPDAV